MSEEKKYYYLKLKDNFFDREEIRVIKGMDKGDTYVCIMLEMYLRSLKRDGLLMMTDRIPYSLKTLSSVLGRSKDEVKYAVELFKEFRLLEVFETGEMFMSDIHNFIGQSSTEADRKRGYRKKIETYVSTGQMSGQISTPPATSSKNSKKGQMSGQTSDKYPPEIEIEIEIEIENKHIKDLLCPFFQEKDFQDSWMEWMEIRKTKRASKSDQAINRAKNKIMKLSGGNKELAIRIINQSSDSGWADLFELRPQKTNGVLVQEKAPATVLNCRTVTTQHEKKYQTIDNVIKSENKKFEQYENEFDALPENEKKRFFDMVPPGTPKYSKKQFALKEYMEENFYEC